MLICLPKNGCIGIIRNISSSPASIVLSTNSSRSTIIAIDCSGATIKDEPKKSACSMSEASFPDRFRIFPFASAVFTHCSLSDF